MGETLTERRRVRDEGVTHRKPLSEGRNAPMVNRGETLPSEEAPANYVPAAAVIRRGQALFGFTGRKGSVGGRLSPV